MLLARDMLRYFCSPPDLISSAGCLVVMHPPTSLYRSTYPAGGDDVQVTTCRRQNFGGDIVAPPPPRRNTRL